MSARLGFRFAVALLAGTAAAGAGAASVDCTVLRQGRTPSVTASVFMPADRPGKTVLTQPGHFCLAEDFSVRARKVLSSEGLKIISDDTLLLSLSASEIDLDLRGHSLSSNAQLEAGIQTPRGKPTTTLVKNPPAVLPTDIYIHDGEIELTRHGTAIEIGGLGPLELLMNIVVDPKREDFPEAAGYPDVLQRDMQYALTQRKLVRASFRHGPSDYPSRRLRIERMRITSKSYAVVLQGADSVVRDSVIETESGTALWLYGPRAIVENNTFIVHCRQIALSEEGEARCDNMDAPIRLMHGDGAMIRNNRFVLAGVRPTRAVSLFETGEMSFEGNTIIGTSKLEDAVVAFSGLVKLKPGKPNSLAH